MRLVTTFHTGLPLISTWMDLKSSTGKGGGSQLFRQILHGKANSLPLAD